jgi:hypothetical protein
MAQFYGGVHGQAGEATRLGSKRSGLNVFANGWNVGAKVSIEHEDGRDVVRVYRTKGSGADRRIRGGEDRVSAWIVSKRHIDYIVTAGVPARRGITPNREWLLLPGRCLRPRQPR